MGGLSQKEIQHRNQISSSSKVYRVDSEILRLILPQVASLDEIVSSWELWLAMDITIGDFTTKVGSIEIIRGPYQFLADVLEKEAIQFMREVERIRPIHLEVSNPAPGQSFELREYLSRADIENLVESFQEQYEPRELGGKSEIHPLKYLESVFMLSSRIRKVSRRTQKFWFGFPANKADRSLIERLISTNFYEGCRLSYDLQGAKPNYTYVPVDHLMWLVKQEGYRVKRDKPIADITKPFSSVSGLDVTSLVRLSRQFDFMSRSEMCSIVSACQHLPSLRIPLWITFGDLRIGPSTEKMKSAGIRYDFVRVLGTDEDYFSLTYKVGHRWVHDVINFGASEMENKEDNHDVWRVASLEPNSLIECEVKAEDGMIWLFTHGLRALPLAIDPLQGTTEFIISPPFPRPEEQKWLNGPLENETAQEIMRHFIAPPEEIPMDDGELDHGEDTWDVDAHDLVASFLYDGEEKNEEKESRPVTPESSIEEVESHQISSSGRYVSGVNELQYARAYERDAARLDKDDDYQPVIKLRLPVFLKIPPDKMTWTGLRRWIESQTGSDAIWLKDHVVRIVKRSLPLQSWINMRR